MASTLAVIESARISSIIEEALEKLSFLASITPDVMAHRDELSQIVGDEITRIIQEQRGLELRYEELIAQRSSLKALSNKVSRQRRARLRLAPLLSRHDRACAGQIQGEPGADQGGCARAARIDQGAVQESQGAWPAAAAATAFRGARSRPAACDLLLTSVRRWCSQGNPNIAENLSKIQTERSNLQNLLSKTLRELRENSFSTLTTTVEVRAWPPHVARLLATCRRQPHAAPHRHPCRRVSDPAPCAAACFQEEKARNDMILEVIAKEKEVSAAVKQLQEDLANERHQHEAEVEERNEIIAKLKEELQEVRTKSAIETKYLQKESRARLQSLNRVYGQSTSDLDEGIWKVRKQLEIEVLANRESEEFLRRKQQFLQSEIQKWMGKYDTDIEDAEKELEQLKASRAEDLVKLNDYTERYTKEMEEKARREEEARIRAEMEALRKQEEERNSWAATKVQALWRGYLARKAASGGKKGKKGKGGKGGKGKKKK